MQGVNQRECVGSSSVRGARRVGRQELNASIQEALRCAPMVGSLVAVAARLDPAALVGTGRVVGVVDHWAARVGFELPVDDHGASDRDGHARRKGQVVVDLNYDTLAEVDAEALVGAIRAVAVRKQDNHQALNGHLRRAAVVQGGDEALVVRPDGVAARERCRENAADQHQLAGCWPPR
jgi:hypothetical protein